MQSASHSNRSAASRKRKYRFPQKQKQYKRIIAPASSSSEGEEEETTPAAASDRVIRVSVICSVGNAGPIRSTTPVAKCEELMKKPQSNPQTELDQKVDNRVHVIQWKRREEVVEESDEELSDFLTRFLKGEYVFDSCPNPPVIPLE